MAWNDIWGRRKELNLDQFGITQTETKLSQGADTVRQRINETYVWLLTPTQAPDGRDITFTAVKVKAMAPSQNGSRARRSATTPSSPYTGHRTCGSNSTASRFGAAST